MPAFTCASKWPPPIPCRNPKFDRASILPPPASNLLKTHSWSITTCPPQHYTRFMIKNFTIRGFSTIAFARRFSFVSARRDPTSTDFVLNWGGTKLLRNNTKLAAVVPSRRRTQKFVILDLLRFFQDYRFDLPKLIFFGDNCFV